MARILRAGTCVHKPYKFVSFTVDGIPVKLPESVAALQLVTNPQLKLLGKTRAIIEVVGSFWMKLFVAVSVQ